MNPYRYDFEPTPQEKAFERGWRDKRRGKPRNPPEGPTDAIRAYSKGWNAATVEGWKNERAPATKA